MNEFQVGFAGYKDGTILCGIGLNEIVTVIAEPLPNSLVFALIAWSIYEYLITLHHEMKVLWQQKWTIASGLFIINRYLLLASTILQLATLKYFDTCINLINFTGSIEGSPGSMRAASIAAFTINTAQYIIMAVFPALRVYAIWGRSVTLLILTLILSSGQVLVNISIIYVTPALFAQILIQTSTCSLAYSEAGAHSTMRLDSEPEVTTWTPEEMVAPFLVVSIAMRCLAATVDIFILSLTWKKTFRSWRSASKLGVRTLVTTLLLRDGTIYFVSTSGGVMISALIVLTIGQLVLNLGLDGPASIYTANQGIISVITPTFACILISRFLMNLRDVSDHPNGTVHTEFNSRFSVPGFHIPPLRTIIGNLGEDLDYGPTSEIYDIPEESERPQDGATQYSSH